MKKLYRGTRTITTREEVQVIAESYDEAMNKIEDDNDDVEVLSENDGDYEISGKLTELTLKD